MDVVTKVDADGKKRAYIASGTLGLSSVDLSSITSAPPTAKAVGASDILFSGEHIAASGTIALVTGQSTDGMAHLWVLDIDDPVYPKVVGDLDTDILVQTSGGFRDVAFNSTAKLAVVAAGNQGMLVIDLIDPANPYIYKTYPTPNPAGVALNSTGTLAYVADRTNGLIILNVSRTSAPTFAGSLTFSNAIPVDVSVNGNIACLVDQGGTFKVIDVSDSSAPKYVGVKTLSGFGFRVSMYGTRAAVISESQYFSYLELYNISTPAAPVREGDPVAVGPPGTAKGVYLNGSYAYVAANSAGIKFYSIGSSPLLPDVAIPGTAYDVAANSSYAYTTGIPATVAIIKLP
jgi:hypothetical protein